MVHDQLFQYCNQFWKRSPHNNPQDDDWDTYQVIPRVNMLEFLEDSLEHWKTVIRQSKATSSPGIDGFTFAELKMLPDVFVRKLACIVAQLESFPSWVMLARTIPLPKPKHTPEAKDSRPITILATIYRVLARVVCSRILVAALGNQLPSSITGLLPGPGARSAMYGFYVLLERAKARNQGHIGITLDVRKCFNLNIVPGQEISFNFLAFRQHW